MANNIIASGLDDIVKFYGIKIIDVDSEDCDEVESCGELHHIPKCFREYPARIAVPSASKRKGMIFSNNIKLFVGAVPKKPYQFNEGAAPEDVPRPRLHQNLNLSVANLFLAVRKYSPFQFYLNGGLAYNENTGEFSFAETFVGDDALELDCHIYQNFFNDCEFPGYLEILKARRPIDDATI